MTSRRDFLKTSALAMGGFAMMGLPSTAAEIKKTKGANDKIKVGVIGFSNRFKGSLLPAFQASANELGFEIVAVSDIWRLRREEAVKHFKEKYNQDIKVFRNNEELYDARICDAVIFSTADFQHPLHLAEAVTAGCDVYCEKPFAETMADARLALETAHKYNKIIQIGSQRRSAPNYQAAYDYLQTGKFGPVNMVEMCWNVNQPGRWRLPALEKICFEKDTDWKRYLMNRPYEPWDARKYLEYRLFWPYSSGLCGQWMSHQIDTVHWFTGLQHPRSVSANGGIYCWKDGRRNFDTMTAALEYGDDEHAFQVLYHSRMTNGAGGTKEIYYSTGGMLNLATNEINSEGGLAKWAADEVGMEPFLLESYKLPEIKINTDANMNNDPMTYLHMRNWMECIKSRKQTNAPVEAGYSHAIALIMTNAALRTGEKVTFDDATQEVMAGGKVFQY